MAYNNWRFFNQPMVGNWRHLPDDMSLARGPTIVILPDGRRLRVPAQMKNNVSAPANKHDEDDGESMLKSLQRMLAGRHNLPRPRAARGAAGAAAGFKPRQEVGGELGPQGARQVMEGGQPAAEM